MSDILEEVLRDHSDEKKIYYLKKFLPIIISVTILIIAWMLYNNWNQNRKLNDKIHSSDEFFEILSRNPDIDKNAYNDLGEIAKENNNVAKLAKLKLIAIELKNYNYKVAKNSLEQIIMSKEYDADMITKSYAYMSWLGLVLDNPESLDKDKFEQNLSIFDENKKYPFKTTIDLLKANWYLKDNQQDKAKILLQKILESEDTLSFSKEQAKALLSTLQ